MALNHRDHLGGRGNHFPFKKAESFQIAPTHTYEGLTMPSIRLPSQLVRWSSNHSICFTCIFHVTKKNQQRPHGSNQNGEIQGLYIFLSQTLPVEFFHASLTLKDK